ncbi:phenylalanine--tRNA ligase subunit beta [Deferribacteraceae bacterium V6Fe1]|nr:phenylalanine--tRNA ligase subunit beta [Deferribacteraceae bacterium V6Fe1]
MKVSLDWLKDFIDIDGIDPHEIADRLTMSGLEVEAVEYIPAIENIVVANVLEKKKHPDADKLSVCKVYDGNEEYQVVCGAKNVDKGQNIVFCKIGAVLPGDFKIKKAKIRGVESFGMIASLSELGLEEKSEGIYVLPEDIKIGDDPNKILGLGDYVLEISITPNRADCLSVIGVAREIAALYGLQVKEREFSIQELEEDANKYSYVKVKNSEICPVYLGRIIKDVTIKQSPLYIQNRLRKAGIRPINNIVDVTNYVLLEYGQPLHTFDLNEIEGGIVVRNADKGEKIVTLDGKEKVLDESMLVIADEKKAVAVAGVMGGEYSGINDNTKDVFLECAYFKPDSIRLTARRLGMQTDSSYRYERGIDMKNTYKMVDYAAYLLSKLSGGKILKNTLSDNPKGYEDKEVKVNFDKINSYIGLQISEDEIVNILKRLNFKLSKQGTDYVVVPPSYRVDIEIWQDIVEEVARVYGYNNIPTSTPEILADGRVKKPLLKAVMDIKRHLAALGFVEAINYSFTSEKILSHFDDSKKFVKLLNPISEDLAVMRTFVFPSLLMNIKNNLNNGYKNVRFFEVASTYLKKDDGLPEQKVSLSIAVTDDFFGLYWDKIKKTETFYYLKGVLENIGKFFNVNFNFVRSDFEFLHPGKSADIYIEDKKIGFIGCIHPDINEKIDIDLPVYVAELELEELVNIVKDRKIKFKSFSVYPFVYKDLSLLVKKDIFSEDIRKFILSYDPLIENCIVFDKFEDEKIGLENVSLAFRIYFLHNEKTLTDEETNGILTRLVSDLEKRFLAKLR